jgi:hypothetical protein
MPAAMIFLTILFVPCGYACRATGLTKPTSTGRNS